MGLYRNADEIMLLLGLKLLFTRGINCAVFTVAHEALRGAVPMTLSDFISGLFPTDLLR